MADTKDYTRVSKGNVTVAYAEPDEVTGGYKADNLKSIGCIKGDLSIPHTRAEETEDIMDWCRVLEEEALAVTETGELSINASFTLAMVLGDEIQKTLGDQFANNERGYLQVKFSDGNTSPGPNTLEYVYEVKIQEFTPTGRESGTSDFTVNMVVTNIESRTHTIAS